MPDHDLQRITGLYAAGELVGGLFCCNHLGGTRLISAAAVVEG